MPINRRPYNGEVDLPRLIPLLQNMPTETCHLIDLPYRLSSPRMQDGKNGCIWQLDDGTVVGFAAWQHYWAMLDYFILPGSYRQEVEEEIFAWALERFAALDRERGQPLPYWIEFREDDAARQATIEAHGFHLDEDYHYVQLRHDLSALPGESALPKGFTLRPFGGEREVDAYVALHRAAFESDSMTFDWRARTLRTPQYRPELDLVVVAPDGSLAGFCIGWLDQQRRLGQVEPLGVHPDYHRLGLARALLRELLQRFKALGVQAALVETWNTMLPALQTYEAAGFRPTHKLLLKGRWVTQQPPTKE